MNPVTMEVISNSLYSIAGEMGEVLSARALSPGISQGLNYSTAIYTKEGALVSLGSHIPAHLGLLQSLARAVLKIHPLQTLAQGDTIITNDPYRRGLQSPWVCAVSPVSHNNIPLALVASIAHHADIGGLAPGGMPTHSKEIFHEGIRIPPVKIVRRGELDGELLSLLTSNLRTPAEFTADISAQLSAAKHAARRLGELSGKHGQDRLKLYMAEIICRTEARARKAFNMPSGTCSFEDYIKIHGERGNALNINLTVTKDDQFLTFDFTGTHPQVEHPLNSPRELTLSGVYYAVRAAFCPEMPVDDGFFRAIRVITPEGTLLNPRFPAPLALAGSITAHRVADAVFGSLAGSVPQNIEAAGTGSANVFNLGGIWPPGGKYFALSQPHGGGQGAGATEDGADGVAQGITNITSAPVEIIEKHFPIIVKSTGLIPDSGGPGKFRGGMGIRTTYGLLSRSAVTVSTGRDISGPWGIAGGLPGRTSKVFIENNAGEKQTVSSGKFFGTLEEGFAITIETAGGGGYGLPLERDPEMVRKDVMQGNVSLEQASEAYGVILSGPELMVDYRATAEKRAEMAGESTNRQ